MTKGCSRGLLRGVLRAFLPAFVLLVAGVVAAQTSVPPAGAAQPATRQAATKANKTDEATKPSAKGDGSGFKMVLEPRAMALIKATSDKLAAAKSMSFTAVVGYEYPSKLGPPIVYTTRYDVAMQRPDKLRVLMPGDGPVSEFYYDGKTMTAYAPVENLAAVVDAPPTVGAMLQAAFRNAAIYFPFSDALVADPYTAFTEGAILAFYVGPSAMIGGTKTDMVVWANPDVFVQMWIGTEDKLPRRMRAIFAADPLALRHEMELSNWQLDPVLPPDTFASTKAQSAGRMAFASPAPPPRGARPITMDKSAKPAPAK